MGSCLLVLVKLRMKTSVKSTQLLMLGGLQAVEPRSGNALKHERDVLHGNALVAVCYADDGGVVNQPVLRLHGAGVFGRVSWEREPFGEGLVSNAGAETRRTQLIFLF